MAVQEDGINPGQTAVKPIRYCQREHELLRMLDTKRMQWHTVFVGITNELRRDGRSDMCSKRVD